MNDSDRGRKTAIEKTQGKRLICCSCLGYIKKKLKDNIERDVIGTRKINREMKRDRENKKTKPSRILHHTCHISNDGKELVES